MNEEKDIRTLCRRHADNYREAGYQLIRTSERLVDRCYLCEAMGFEYEIRRPEYKHGKGV